MALTPAQRLRSVRVARALATGELPMPQLRCTFCSATSLTAEQTSLVDPEAPKDVDTLVCLLCGRKTSTMAARRARQAEVRAIIVAAAG